MIKSHHIVERIDKEASGLTYAVTNICRAVQGTESACSLHVLNYPLEKKYSFPVTTYDYWRLIPKVPHSPSMFSNLKELALEGGIFHNHSLWRMPNWYAGQIAKHKKENTKVIFSPHGTISPWALNHSKWQKKFFWYFGQKNILAFADCFHATAEAEYEFIRQLGFKQPVAIIPLGIELYNIPSKPSRLKKEPHQLLFFGRVHPQKGLDLLIKVWQKIQDKFPDWELVIGGPEGKVGYLSDLDNLIKKLGCKRVRLIGPQYGEEKKQLYRNASLYVLPSYTENFGLTVAEALYEGLPAIVGKGAPWKVLEEENCGWWIELNESDLEKALVTSMRLPEEVRIAMGLKGHDWIKANMKWETIGKQFNQLYQWMLDPSDSPSFLIKD